MAYTQEELTALFERNFTLQNPAPIIQQPVAPPPAPAPSNEITYSVSQHYNHSSHLIVRNPPAPTPAPTDDATISIILSRHGVDASTLFPSQIELFRTADPTQQMRLVELWRISPPNYGGHALAQEMGTYPPTSFAQEEAMAQVRWEQKQQQQQAEVKAEVRNVEMSDDMMSDSEQSNAPLTPIQGGDSRWCSSAPEPYMMSGYEALARREYEMSAQPVQRVPATDAYSLFGTRIGGYKKATDPVYASGNQRWERTPEEQQVAMANQYGWQQERMANVRMGGYREDEEML